MMTAQEAKNAKYRIKLERGIAATIIEPTNPNNTVEFKIEVRGAQLESYIEVNTWLLHNPDTRRKTATGRMKY